MPTVIDSRLAVAGPERDRAEACTHCRTHDGEIHPVRMPLSDRGAYLAGPTPGIYIPFHRIESFGEVRFGEYRPVVTDGEDPAPSDEGPGDGDPLIAAIRATHAEWKTADRHTAQDDPGATAAHDHPRAGLGVAGADSDLGELVRLAYTTRGKDLDELSGNTGVSRETLAMLLDTHHPQERDRAEGAVGGATTTDGKASPMSADAEYVPVIHLGDEDMPLIPRVHGCTHCRDTRGRVWKIFPHLNRKSVPLNHAGNGPQRLPLSRVESLGTLLAPQADPRGKQV